MTKERKRNITQADLAAAARLKALWDAAVRKRKDEGRPLTQQVMAEKLADATGRGGTQGLVSQYLNARIALNYRALLAFADEIGFDPRDVRDDLPEQQLQAAERPRASAPRQLFTRERYAEGDAIALQIGVQGLLTALLRRVPGSSAAFVEYVEDAAKERGFGLEKGFLTRLVRNAKAVRRTEEAADQALRRGGPAVRTKRGT